MTEVAFSVVPALTQKRAHDTCLDLEEHITHHSTPTLLAYEHTMEQHDTKAEQEESIVVRCDSPAPSTASSLTEISTLASASRPQTAGEPPSKKRKLNFLEREAEKAAKQRDKDEKSRLKEEEKVRKEEEKARKDEEKRKAAEEKENAKRAKDLEKAEKQKAKEEREAKKEAEKQKKEAEKNQKEAEKLKKERVCIPV